MATSDDPPGSRSSLRAAVLALQGSVEPHRRTIEGMGHPVRTIRRPDQLEGVTHLVLPGGESTTLQRLLELYGLWRRIGKRARAGQLALFGTCAGAILLGRPSEQRPPRWDLFDGEVNRNAYGTQRDSFVAPLDSDRFSNFEAVFIRAPKFGILGERTQVLATCRGEPVLVQDGRHLASTFHPELADDPRIHAYFLGL